MSRSPELSFVIPCLNEAETLEECIRAAQECIQRYGMEAEVVVSDNGSSDGSREIAVRCGARLVDAPQRGYGSALMAGFDAARGELLIMGDADRSYDFREAMPMVEAMRSGVDLVMGSRLRGRIDPGAMPWLHRWLGNPLLSFIGRVFFRASLSDFHCGMRGITRKAYQSLGLRTTGMEFASEMVVKAVARGLRISEVPISLHRDGRTRPPHLRTWRDGWRHLRFMMVLSPRWTLMLPGLLVFALGAGVLAAISSGPVTVTYVTLDVHTMLVASLLVILGYQAMTIAVAMRIYAVEEEIGPPASWMRRAFEFFTLERGILVGLGLGSAGALLIGGVAWDWASAGFPPLDVAGTLRPVVLGTTLVALGGQTLLMSFVYSMLGIQRRRR